ncbi:ATP-binding protein [Bacillus wiedmannii]|uniref:AAA family ATPase n=1 Tax=Bacillus wiedmannii TaxID=1890302 RepID=UPI00065BA801|nr:ATP-binding protein [Bacillus wiedmannii]KMP24516.1 hypothetical protein TU50_25800 [Bacillus wiedmannii]PGC21566.1 ATP-binding protein [Bacillus wiedmannii]
MLMRFNVKNFLSFDEMQEFAMTAGNVRNKEQHLIKGKSINLLKFSALYGPNASGKSSFVKALKFSKEIILNGLNYNSNDKYFRLKSDTAIKPTTFEYEFNIGMKYYAYGFNLLLSESKITGEWLYELKPSGESLIYERDLIINDFKQGIKFKTEASKTRFDIYSEDILNNKNVLFISEINRNKESVFEKHEEFRVFNDIFNWFTKTLDINFPDDPVSSTDFFVDNDKENNDRLFALLDCLGTGITDFKLVNTSVEEVRKQIPLQILKNIENELRKHKEGVVHFRSKNNLHIIRLDEKKENLEFQTMYFFHGTNGGNFTLGEESDGTRRLLDLIEILLSESEKVYVIDEIDRSLHPNLTHKFIELFLDMLADKRIQLIITTHEDRLLDLGLLRRDEVWFVEKQEDGSSKLYSLEKYKTRFDKRILNSYLEGRYGAVPKFKRLSFLEDKNNSEEG